MLSVAKSDGIPLQTAPTRQRRIILLKDGDAELLVRQIATTFRSGLELVQTLDLTGERWAETLAFELDPENLKRYQISMVLVSYSASGKVSAELLLRCRLAGIRVLGEATFWEEQARWIDIDGRDPNWFLCSEGFRASALTEARVRLFDILMATLLLVVTLPVMLVVAVLIKFDSRGPIFYRQERVGRDGRPFMLFKFRSMVDNAEKDGRPCWAEVADPRITRIGRFIRYARIDELPQLLNVLRGDMSMIGPRPERPFFVERLSAALPCYAARHYVRPGITGWAQVKASYGASLEDGREKLRYDLYYIKHRSLRLDLSILLRTVRVVLNGEGAR